MGSEHRHHVLIFPFMAKGHLISLLDLSKALSHRGLKVSIITTPSNSPFILDSISSHPNVHPLVLEFPKVDGLPVGCESTDQLPSMDLHFTFVQATKQLRKPFQQLLQSLSNRQDLPICVISDFFFGWSLWVCQEFHVPRLVFHGMGAFSMATCKYVPRHAPHKRVNSSAGETFTVQGVPLTLEDLLYGITLMEEDPGNPFCQFLIETVEADENSWGVLLNSFMELEPDFVTPLESFYQGGAKAWCVGPLCLYNHEAAEKSDPNAKRQMCIEWLDQHANGARSVIYVSFGTQAQLSHTQLDEIGLGLEMSGHQFVWVVRSDSWEPPEGLDERLVDGKGLIVRGFVDQRGVLAHEATGGFLSHCGWNSVLESLAAGVPLLAWPMIAEQALNAKLVVEVLKAGDRIPNGSNGAVVDREIICQKMRELMGGEKGEVAQELSRLAKQAVHEGGSSNTCLTRLIDELITPTIHLA